MYVIQPNAITDAVLVSSSVPENDYPAWVSGTSYYTGDRVIRSTTHKVYQALAFYAASSPPEEVPTSWVEVGATNRWRMLDSEVGTATTATGSLTVVLAPGYATALALFDVAANSYSVTIRDASDAVTYTASGSLDTSVILSWFDYYFTDPVPKSELVFSDLYIGVGYEVEVTLSGGDVACGALAVGVASDLGAVEYGATLGIIDYSRKDTDEFGGVSITRRKYAKRLTARLAFERERMGRVYRTLAALRATPCVFVTSDASDYESMTVYGFWRDFRIDVSYPTHNYCSLEIEGLI